MPGTDHERAVPDHARWAMQRRLVEDPGEQSESGSGLNSVIMFPLGRWAYARAHHRKRVRGTIGQY